MTEEKIILLRIEEKLNNVSGGSGTTGGALETTLQQVLAELRDDPYITNTVWVDNAGTNLIRREVVDADTGVISVNWVDPSSNAIVVPSLPVSPLTSSNEDIVYLALVDDVAGDLSGALINYYAIYSVNRTNGNRSLLTTVDEKFANYTVLGTPRSADEIGVNAVTNFRRETIPPLGTWSPTGLTASFAIRVITIGNPALPPTFTDSNNVTTNLVENEILTSDLITGTDQFDLANFVITSRDAGDQILVVYTDLG